MGNLNSLTNLNDLAIVPYFEETPHLYVVRYGDDAIVTDGFVAIRLPLAHALFQCDRFGGGFSPDWETVELVDGMQTKSSRPGLRKKLIDRWEGWIDDSREPLTWTRFRYNVDTLDCRVLLLPDLTPILVQQRFLRLIDSRALGEWLDYRAAGPNQPIVIRAGDGPVAIAMPVLHKLGAGDLPRLPAFEQAAVEVAR